MAGDFNAVLSSGERRGSSTSYYNLEIREFSTFVEDMEIIDVPVIGKKFTYFAADGYLDE